MRARFILTCTAVVALLLAAACGGGSSEAEEPTATPPPDSPIPTATPFATQPPATVIAAPSPSPPEQVTYVVRAGDTLSQIAGRFDTTVQAIMELNELTNTVIRVDQQLLIPSADGTATGTPAASPTPDTAGVTTYVVRAGDTAYAIALRFGTTLGELAKANNTTVAELDSLVVGEELTLPRPR